MDFEYIEKLIKLIDSSQLREFQVEENGLKIYMSKNSFNTATGETAAKVSFSAGKVEEPETVTSAEATGDHDRDHIVKSPIVGTFYASPEEGGEPYVKVGDRISKGKVLCIVEAMKLMNEIESEIDGTVSEIFVSDGDIVEYGQPIMAIRP